MQRENRRGRQYDAIIMDPPSYGRGPSGEVWKIENELYPLIEECMKILSDKPLFFLINSYTTGLSAQVLINVLSMTVGRKYGGKITADEIGLDEVVTLKGDSAFNYQNCRQDENGRDRLNFAFIAIDESGNSVSYIPQFKEKTKYTFKN